MALFLNMLGTTPNNFVMGSKPDRGSSPLTVTLTLTVTAGAVITGKHPQFTTRQQVSGRLPTSLPGYRGKFYWYPW
eukprot:1714795-Rhodomonas_salina.4